MTKTRIIGWTAMAVCVLGYGGFVAVLVANRFDYLTLTQTALFGGALAVIGEVGLWVGAGCLGLTLFKRRKAMLDRLLGRKPAAGDA
ncbi:hypothetical protein GVN24_28675 [Rhizobium sp. CRIBSB]|nr:hypothetical protein [Rhizobium sp. CRIBSB]